MSNNSTSLLMAALGGPAMLTLGVATFEPVSEDAGQASSTLNEPKSCILAEKSKCCVLDVSDNCESAEVEQYPIFFGKTVFCFDDNAHIRLRSKLVLKQTSDMKAMVVTNWNNAEIPFEGFSEKSIEAELLRFFQKMYAKSSSGTLSEQEKKTWFKMLKSFDYASFSQEMVPPMYELGEIVALNNDYVTIVWTDKKRQSIPVEKSVRFQNGTLRKGDHIGAMVKRGVRDEIVSIDEIALLPESKDISVDWSEVKAV